MDTCRICNHQTYSGSICENCAASFEDVEDEESLRRERDEARALVREYWKRLKGHPTMLTYEFHLKKYPWLKDDE